MNIIVHINHREVHQTNWNWLSHFRALYNQNSKFIQTFRWFQHYQKKLVPIQTIFKIVLIPIFYQYHHHLSLRRPTVGLRPFQARATMPCSQPSTSSRFPLPACVIGPPSLRSLLFSRSWDFSAIRRLFRPLRVDCGVAKESPMQALAGSFLRKERKKSIIHVPWRALTCRSLIPWLLGTQFNS